MSLTVDLTPYVVTLAGCLAGILGYLVADRWFSRPPWIKR